MDDDLGGGIRIMTADDVRNMLRKACEAAGSATAWAEKNDISLQYVSDVLNSRRAPGPKALRALGLIGEMTYRRSK